MSADPPPPVETPEEPEPEIQLGLAHGLLPFAGSVFGFAAGIAAGAIMQVLLFGLFVPYVHRLPLGVPLVTVLAPGITSSFSLIYFLRRMREKRPPNAIVDRGPDAAALGVAMSCLLIGICAGITNN